jgi:serine protease Do
MRSNFYARTRKWIAASALAIIVGLGGGTAFLAASSPMVAAQVTPAAQITPPANVAAAPNAGFADLVAAVKPAVVSILVEGREQANSFDNNGDFNGQIPDLPDDNPLKKFFQQFGNPDGGHKAQPGAPGQPAPQAPQGRRYQAAGSGFIISADGYIVTNNHVVENATKVTVTFDDGSTKSATVVGTDKRTDLAVVKVDGATDLPFVKFSSDDARVGDWVLAVGNPFGLGGTVTAGIISARGRDVAGSQYGDFLQIDAAVNMGNSGGPTFNMKGEVVGVNTEIFSPNGGNVGIAFDIPAKTVQQVADQLIKSGSVTRGYLGVSIQDVTQDIADSVGLKTAKGALVSQLADDSPGGKAGIQSGDIITAVDGEQVDNALALSRIIGSKAPGAQVQLTVWRANKEQTITATLGTLKDDTNNPNPNQPTPPDQQQGAPVTSSVGLTLVPNANGDGVLVQDVDPNSVAADKGFAVGDTILEVDNKKVSNGQDFESAIKAVKDSGRGTALIKEQRDGQVRFIGLPLTAKQG